MNDLKAKALSPPRATKVTDLDKILTDWKHVRQQIMEEDSSYSMTGETLQTILLKIMPTAYVKEVRELITKGKYKDDYHGFEQALYDEIATRKMDEEAGKAGGNIGAVAGQHEPRKCDETGKAGWGDMQEVEVWSEEWQATYAGWHPRGRGADRAAGAETSR